MSISLVPSASPAPAPQRYASGEEYVSWNLVSGMVRRRWPALLLSLALCIGLALAYIMVTPPTYEAATSILVEDEKLNIPAVAEKLNPNESDINTQVALLRSARLHEQVVRDLGLRVGVVLPSRTPRSQLLTSAVVSDSADTATVRITRQGSGYFRAQNLTTGASMDSITAGEKVSLSGVEFALAPAAYEEPEIELSVASMKDAMYALSEQVKVVRPDRDANLIWIRTRDIDPQTAGLIPDLLAQHYIESRIDATRGKAQRAVEYLRGQADTMQAQLMAAEEQLKNYRERAGIVSMPDEATAAVAQNTDLGTIRAKVEAERSALQRVLSEADAGHDSTGGPSPYRRLAAFPTLVNNPTVSDLLHTLNELETQQAQILLRRTPTDPDAKAIASRIADVDGQLRGWTRTYLQGLESHVASLDAQVSSKRRSAAALPAKGMEEERLSRRPKLLSEVYSLLETRLQEARIAESAADPGVTIVDRAGVPDKPVWPRPFLILAVAGVVGLLMGGALAWMRDTMDGAVHSRAEAISATGAPVLGMIPHIEMLRRKRGQTGPPLLISNSVPTLGARLGGRQNEKDRAMLIGGAEASAAALEAYAWLETSLALARPNGDLRTVAFTSPMSREGKTVTAANLALSAAWRGRKVLLIDADLRRGMTHHLFGISRERGLADVLAGTTQLTQAIRVIPLGNGATVHVLPCGERSGHPAGLFRSGGMSGLLEAFRARYDLVIVDTPPVNLVSDSLILSQLVDGVVLVARSGQTDATSLAQASRHLQTAGAPLLGVLLNDINVARDGSYDDAFRYLDEAGAYAAAGPAHES
ncbi:MAG TPA: polysaccharide biosynthesis tyrosine autokinase [Gemmatimonadales bacterium]|nr:polysaccharide biosynthesis tyrosine autokinase [Gemmatimonadales bacterium]